MDRKCISTRIISVDIGAELATMKLNNTHLIVIASIIMAFLLGNIGGILNIFSASTGMAHSNLKTIGMAIAYALREKKAFPRDGGSDDKDHQAGQANQWCSLFDVKEVLSETGRRVDKDIPKEFFDAGIWTVVKNIPDEPPSNLIVLATRNIESSSLRTRLTNEDMQKQFRFRKEPDDLWILNKYAILIFVDGKCLSVPLVPPASRRVNRATYSYIYRCQPFDLTTNTVSGLQVKYLTPDGEVVPAND